jgi:hypothetical protein
MAISPCNSLNVKTLRISQLASSTIDSNDLLMISQYDNINNVYYSKKATFSNLITYFGSVNAAYKGSFTGSLDITSGFTGSTVTISPSAGTFANDNFLPVFFNGNPYKIPLYPNS